MPCPICGGEGGGDGGTYPNLVCDECDERAVNVREEPAKPGNAVLKEGDTVLVEGDKVQVEIPTDIGDNPVFIDGQKCWRRYRFGGWVTMMDEHDCDSLEEFYEKHGVM